MFSKSTQISHSMCARLTCESGSLVGVYKSPSGSLNNSTSWSFYVSGRLTKVHRLSKVLQVRFVSVNVKQKYTRFELCQLTYMNF